jgi:class 3 adenylate cyclase
MGTDRSPTRDADRRGRVRAYNLMIGGFRLVGVSVASGLVALLARNGDLPWARWREVSALSLGAALLFLVVAPKVARSIRAGQWSVVCDVPVYAWCAERTGLVGPFLVYTTVCVVLNLSATFGLAEAGLGLFAFAALVALLHAVVGTPAHFVTTSVSAQVYVAAALAFYVALVGSEALRSSRRLNRARADLRGLASTLEQRVADRTAALASTNAAIQRFVPREFLHALGHDDVTTTKLGDATARSITVLFADIRNFTSSSEGMSPEETFAFLNGCLSKLGPHVRAQSGFVDKYIGDAIMALFPRDPSDAVRAAIAMQEELRRTNEEAGGRVPLAIGVGVHVGRVMMGTIGEAERFEATVISDAVNLTARLESLTKQLGCAVLISEEVHATLGADLRAHTRRLGTFLVKGKAQAVTLHEVFASDAAALREAKIRTRARFEEMLENHAQGRAEAALAIAGELRDEAPDDGPASWWFLRLARESAAGDDAVPSSRGIVRLEEK